MPRRMVVIYTTLAGVGYLVLAIFASDVRTALDILAAVSLALAFLVAATTKEKE